jgi:hypothetical protein
VADTRHDRAGGKSAGARRGPQPKMRARERIASERAARKRAEARRRILVAIASITVVLAFVVALVAVKLTSTPARLVASESQAPSVVVRQVTTVPAAVLARMRPGQAVTPLDTVKTSGPLLTGSPGHRRISPGHRRGHRPGPARRDPPAADHRRIRRLKPRPCAVLASTPGGTMMVCCAQQSRDVPGLQDLGPVPVQRHRRGAQRAADLAHHGDENGQGVRAVRGGPD